MLKSKRAAIIAGNWKMNKTPSEAAATVAETAKLVAGKDGAKIVLCGGHERRDRRRERPLRGEGRVHRRDQRGYA